MGTTEPIDGELTLNALFSLLNRAHMLAVLGEFLVENEPPLRFSQLQDELDLSPNTLSRRLDELTDVDFVARRSYDEIPPRVEYEPTAKLYALEPTFQELAQWMDEYGDDELFVEQMDEMADRQ